MVQKVVGSNPTRHPINIYPRFEKAIGKVTYSNGNTRDGSQNLMLHGRMRCGDTVWKVQSSRIFIYFWRVNFDGDKDRLLTCFVRETVFGSIPMLSAISFNE